VRYQLWAFSTVIPVSVVTTPLVSLGRNSATCSYRKSTVYDMTSGTEQLHSSNSGENFCAVIAVSRTDSIALTGTVLPSILRRIQLIYHYRSIKYIFQYYYYNLPLYIAFRYSENNFAPNFHYSVASHLHQKFSSPKGHYNFPHHYVILSISPPNISLSTILLNSSLKLNK